MEIGLNLNSAEPDIESKSDTPELILTAQMNTLMQLSELPELLHSVNSEYITPNVLNLCNHLHDFQNGIVLLTGPGIGKTTNAVGILLSYLYWKRNTAIIEDLGFYMNVLELLRMHNCRYDEDCRNRFKFLMKRVLECQCVVIDGVPNCMTPADEQLIEEIYEKRLFKNGITIFTASMNPDRVRVGKTLVGRAVARIAGSCKMREVFM